FGKEKEILDFIAMYAPFSKTLNLRVYKRAVELRDAELNWKDEVVSELHIDYRMFVIEKLLRKYRTDLEREKNFPDSRATYYRFKKVFLSKNPDFEKTLKNSKKVVSSAVK
ncbi:hypothetical protein LCGC14_3020600, partial [marine sediment metagenome]